LAVSALVMALGALSGVAAAQGILDRMKNAAERLAPAAFKETEKEVAESLQDITETESDLELSESINRQTRMIDSEKIKQLLGEEPSFVYDPQNRPDPMLVPWTRLRVMSEEAGDIAQRAQEDQDYEKAALAYSQVMILLQNAPASWAHTEKLQKLRQDLEKNSAILEKTREAGGFPLGDQNEARLPAWIQNNTTGIIYHPTKAVVLVGSHTLREGDIVPDPQALVVVEKILPLGVQYRVRDKIFSVNIREGE
jgi:hypothetical protein